MIFIIVFKNWDFFTDTDKYPTRLHQVASGNFATIIIIVGFASLFFTFIDWKCKIGKKETPQKEQDEEGQDSKMIKKKLEAEGPTTEKNDTAEALDSKENIEKIA